MVVLRFVLPVCGCVAALVPLSSARAAQADGAAAPTAAAAGSDGEAPSARVARLARQLLVANADRCPRRRWDFGLTAYRKRAPGAPPLPPGQPVEPDGFGVTLVVPVSPAGRAGLRVQDRIMAVNGHDWTGPGFATTFLRAEQAQPELNRLELRIDRNGTPLTVTLTGDMGCAIPVRLVAQVKPNASASSGMAFINSGLEEALPQDDQLASVIAHEMAHVILGHSKANTDSTTRARMERDADALGVRLSLRAGFDPNAAARAIEVIGARARGPISRLLGLYGDHMPTPQRKSFLLEEAIAARQERQAEQAAGAAAAQR